MAFLQRIDWHFAWHVCWLRHAVVGLSQKKHVCQVTCLKWHPPSLVSSKDTRPASIQRFFQQFGKCVIMLIEPALDMIHIYSYDSVPWQGWCFACWCSSFAWLVCSQRFTQGDAWLKPAKACWDCCLLMLAAFLASLVARGRDSPVKDLAPWPRQPSLCNIVYIW